MPCSIEIYNSTIAYKAIPILIFNAISTWPNTAWRHLKNAYRAYKALFRPGEEVWQGTI